MNSTQSNSEYFISPDISLVSALTCCGYVVEEIDKQQPRRAVFHIRRDNAIEKYIQEYFADNLQVSALTFFNNLKTLKTRIYNI